MSILFQEKIKDNKLIKIIKLSILEVKKIKISIYKLKVSEMKKFDFNLYYMYFIISICIK